MKKHQTEDQVPTGPWHAFLQAIWKLPRLWRNLTFGTTCTLVVIFLVWSTLPDETKTRILSLFRYQKVAPPQTISVTPAPVLGVSRREVIREKSARELVNYLNSLAPLQMESVVQSSYVGRWVRWNGKIQYIRSTESGFHMGVLESDGSYPSTLMQLSREWRDKIETFRIGDLIGYEGRIRFIELGFVTVVDVEILSANQ